MERVEKLKRRHDLKMAIKRARITLKKETAAHDTEPSSEIKKKHTEKILHRHLKKSNGKKSLRRNCDHPTEGPPVNGLEWFADDTGEYFWNFEKESYEHYADLSGSGSNTFQGYHNANQFTEPTGNYSIIFDLSGNKPADVYDPSKTIWSVATPMLAGLEALSATTFTEVKDISDQEKYPGVKIYSSKYMNGAITLGNLIITNPGMEDANTLDHEYGHYLDFKHHFSYNKKQYLKDIGWPSLKSASGSGNHSKSTTERRANRLGGEWSNNKLLKDLFRDAK